MIYAFTNSKGGVGKSTLAVHFTYWLVERGETVALIDADVQGSSSGWLREVASEAAVFRLQSPDDILEQVPSLRSHFTHLVIDGPAGLFEVTRTILFIADTTFLPCGPSVLDLRAANEAIRVVRQAQNIRQGLPRAVLVPNKLQARHRLSRELETAKALGVPSVSGLKLRQAYADAAGQGRVVWQLGPGAAAAGVEIRQFFEEVMSHETGAETNHERRVTAN